MFLILNVMFRVSAQHFSYIIRMIYYIRRFSSQIRQTTIQPNPPPTLIACVLWKVSQVSQQGETQCENSYSPYVLISTLNTFSIPPVLDQAYSKTSSVQCEHILTIYYMFLTEAYHKTAVFTQSPSKLKVGQHDTAELLTRTLECWKGLTMTRFMSVIRSYSSVVWQLLYQCLQSTVVKSCTTITATAHPFSQSQQL